MLHAMHHYRAYGLRIRSSIPFPELMVAPAAQAADLTILRDALTDAPAFAPERSVQVRTTGSTVYAHWTNLGTYAADSGTCIRFCPAPTATPAMQRLPLLGVMMGLILHQRGTCTLHGSAIALPHGAAAFIGPKGAGKSTTAAALQEAGYPLLSDDVLALVRPAPDTPVAIEPAFPQIKLWPDAAQAVGQTPDRLDTIAPRLPKRAWRAPDRFASHAHPLRAIYVLGFGDALACTQLDAREAFVSVLSETYAPRFVGRHGTGANHFHQLAELVRHVPVYQLERPRDLTQLPDLVALLTDSPKTSLDTSPDAPVAHMPTHTMAPLP
ncbi:serine kinase [Longimonas halophila]|uniref:Serine kinase n=1 Tax=Longimonas halophila TaxID=1469170 RepID=A0A2H3P885_9BACT|nr:serine kinase [Longimonas halophila]PEN08858.1 serine kinase [Longimonas halophila]